MVRCTGQQGMTSMSLVPTSLSTVTAEERLSIKQLIRQISHAGEAELDVALVKASDAE
jgi:hypothetical protein